MSWLRPFFRFPAPHSYNGWKRNTDSTYLDVPGPRNQLMGLQMEVTDSEDLPQKPFDPTILKGEEMKPLRILWRYGAEADHYSVGVSQTAAAPELHQPSRAYILPHLDTYAYMYVSTLEGCSRRSRCTRPLTLSSLP